MPCRVGITTNLDRRREEWEDQVVGFRNWIILEQFDNRDDAQAYEDEYAREHGCEEISTHIFDELSKEECGEVLNILSMHSALHQSAQALNDEPAISIRFHGFDGNNETKQMAYTRFYIDELHRFAELIEIAQSPDYNSHYLTLRRYRLMLDEWNGCEDKNNLTRDEINRIFDVRVE